MEKRKIGHMIFTLSLTVVLLGGCGNRGVGETKEAETEAVTQMEVTQTEVTQTEVTQTEVTQTEVTQAAQNSDSYAESQEQENGEDSQKADESSAGEIPTEEPEQDVPVYTYTDLSKTMYAGQTVNVRDLPSISGNKLGALTLNQEVTVTGQCNETSWYRIEYQGSVAYVSDQYLVDNQIETAQSGNSAQGSSTGGYNTFYMENDRISYYASDDGMTCVEIVKETGEKGSVLYTVEGIKTYYPEIGQVIYNDDGSIKILTCGCCSSVETYYGIMSYKGSQATAEALGYHYDHSEFHPDFVNRSWVGNAPDTWPHNLCWYYYVR